MTCLLLLGPYRAFRAGALARRDERKRETQAKGHNRQQLRACDAPDRQFRCLQNSEAQQLPWSSLDCVESHKRENGSDERSLARSLRGGEEHGR